MMGSMTMSMSVRQELAIKNPMGKSCLPRVERWLEEADHRVVVVKVIRATTPRRSYADDLDWFLGAGMPSYRPMIHAFYAGKAPRLAEILTPLQLEMLSDELIESLALIYDRAVHTDVVSQLGFVARAARAGVA